MVIIDNSKYEEAFACLENVEGKGRIRISPNMFLEARNIIVDHGYAIAVNEDGVDEIVFRWLDTTYQHGYTYTGGADMWFLNHYQCIFLRGCNEYSVELCLGALKLWEGKMVVFIGNEWMYLIEQLPELEGKECLWEDELEPETAKEMAGELKYIDVFVGLPYYEKMDRYYDNRMTYDEVMGFTYLFSDKRRLGPNNPNKQFFIVDGSYGNLGLFGIYYKAVSLARYAKKKGFIPVMYIKNEYGELSQYQDFMGDDLWGKFYNQPERYELSEVLNSQNVCFPPFMYNASIMQNIMNGYSKGIDLTSHP